MPAALMQQAFIFSPYEKDNNSLRYGNDCKLFCKCAIRAV